MKKIVGLFNSILTFEVLRIFVGLTALCINGLFLCPNHIGSPTVYSCNGYTEFRPANILSNGLRATVYFSPFNIINTPKY
jgi:hypothetical protein